MRSSPVPSGARHLIAPEPNTQAAAAVEAASLTATMVGWMSVETTSARQTTNRTQARRTSDSCKTCGAQDAR